MPPASELAAAVKTLSAASAQVSPVRRDFSTTFKGDLSATQRC